MKPVINVSVASRMTQTGNRSTSSLWSPTSGYAALQARKCIFLLAVLVGVLSHSAASPAESESDKNDVIFLPTEEFSFELAAQLAKIVAQDTGLKVRAMLNLGTGVWAPYNSVPQYDPAQLRDLARPAIAQLKTTYGGVLYVILTTRDINNPSGNLRFLFAENYAQEKVSVISAARMMFAGAPGQQASPQLVGNRLRKMILRTVGLQYFAMERSADPKNILYSPLMSLDALDTLEAKLSVGSIAEIDSNKHSVARYTELRWSLFNQPSFNPYTVLAVEKALTDDCMKLWRSGKGSEALALCKQALEAFPASILANRMLADMFQIIAKSTNATDMQQVQARALESQYRSAAEGLIQSIVASGDGKSEETAYRVITVTEEYMLLWYRDLQAIRQGLLDRGERKFDVLNARAKDGTETEVYFDVTPLHKKLEASLTSQGTPPPTTPRP